MTENVYVIGACRTAIGSFLGTLKGVTAVELGTHVLKEAIKRAGISPDQIDQVILGTESGKAGDCQRGTAD